MWEILGGEMGKNLIETLCRKGRNRLLPAKKETRHVEMKVLIMCEIYHYLFIIYLSLLSLATRLRVADHEAGDWGGGKLEASIG